MKFYWTLNGKRSKKSINICNFLVGNRVWIVCNGCRKTHTIHPNVGNIQQQTKPYKDAIIAAYSLRALPRVPAPIEHGRTSESGSLKLVRINLINKRICFSKPTKTPPSLLASLTVDNQNNHPTWRQQQQQHQPIIRVKFRISAVLRETVPVHLTATWDIKA